MEGQAEVFHKREGEKMRTLIWIPVLFLLTGCLQFSDDYQQYAGALKAHSEQESIRVERQAQAIADSARVPSATKNEQLLLSVIAMMQIERLAPTKLDINAPVTGYTVLNTVAGHIPFMSTTLGMYKLGEVAVENAGNVVMNADEISNSDSFLDTEIHATGDSNSAAYSADRDSSQDNSVEDNSTTSGGVMP